MKISELNTRLFEEIEVDNVDGLGAVPNNDNIDYMGVRSLMKPSKFLSLTGGHDWNAHEETVKAITDLLQQGKKIASPFLDIEIPDRWLQEDFHWAAPVTGHEGRHRMETIKQLYGDVPVETHIFLKGESFEIRARHIREEWLGQIEKVLKAQFTNKRIMNPFESLGRPNP